MAFTTLISAEALAANLNAPDWVIVDCRFNLKDTNAGRNAWQTAHIPNARYAHLDDDLSGPVQPMKRGGRHPLPDPAILATTLGQLGISNQSQVIAYDDMGGAIASRLWFLLKWLGHDAVAVLDGGWQTWQTDGYSVSTKTPIYTLTQFHAQPNHDLVVNIERVVNNLSEPQFTLLDARAAARYRGEMEPLDPKAGHIPGAISAPFAENMDTDRKFLSAAALKERFTNLLGTQSPNTAVLYCGSGVTACHNFLALSHAGYTGQRLFVGSWSEWSNTTDLACATVAG